MTAGGRLALLFLGAGCVLFVGLAAPPVARRPEERCYGAARSMLREGRWLVPRFRGRPRVEKPPLYAWAAALASLPAGGLTRFTLRLPAALAALALLVLVFRWGRWLGGEALGLWAAVCLLGMVQFYDLGRRGVAEMPLALFSAAGLYLCQRYEAEGGGHRLGLFSLCLALAFLAKATVACLLVGLPLFLHLLLTRRLGAALRLRALLAVGGGLALGALWYLLLLLFRPDAWHRLVSEFLLPFGVRTAAHSATHYRPVYYFFFLLPVLAAPATVFLPLAWERLRRTRFHAADPRRRFPALAFLGLFLAFSLFPQKQRHYLLPLLPLLALVLADGLLAALGEGERRRRWVRRLARAAALTAALLGVLAAAYYHVLLGLAGPAAAAVLAGGSAAAALVRAGRSARVAAVTALTLLTLWGAEVVYQTSYLKWRNAFRVGAARRDDPHWRRVFTRHPWAMRVFRADRPPRRGVEGP